MQKVAATVMEIMYHDELKRVESKKLFTAVIFLV